MRVLVLGGYGFIGAEICRALSASKHEVVGFGRSVVNGKRLLPAVGWLAADMATLCDAKAWHQFLTGIDVVVNAAGVLQDGLHDDVHRVQQQSIVALVAALEKQQTIRLVQISAPRARTNSSTAFMRSKAIADETIRKSSLDWVILRPGLVIGSNAYGGSALIRMLAAFPYVQPIALADRRIQTVALDDVARIAIEAVEGTIAKHSDLDIVEEQAHQLDDIVASFRKWLGFSKASLLIPVPNWALFVIGFFANLAGQLGWRSPLRTSAIRALGDEVLGDPQPLKKVTSTRIKDFEQTLAGIPSTLQERWFARLYLLMPCLVIGLSMFWLVSAGVAIFHVERAAAVVPPDRLAPEISRWLVYSGVALDAILGMGILFRRTAVFACVGMAMTCAAYLVLGTVLTPLLWLDPLGPFVKVLPAALLALVTIPMLQDR